MILIQDDPNNFEDVVSKNTISTTGLLQGAECALLFCNSRNECDHMARKLDWKPYHSSILVAEHLEEMKAWKGGVVTGLACTSMLNCCLNYLSVHYVFHLGPSRDIIDYYQAIGHAGQDGGVGKSIVYFNPMSLPGPTGSSSDPFSKQVIYVIDCFVGDCAPVFFWMVLEFPA
jgi:superfamily II DNA helicase RecQ